MKRISFFVIGFVFVFSAAASAQVRTVTNSDLERYRENREKSEAEMRENYARMGFPSPTEMQLRNDAANRSMIELADKIRADRLEQERLDAQYRAQMAASQRPTVIVVGSDNYDPGYFVQYGYGFGRGLRYGNRFRFNQGFTTTTNGYFAGGQFWPMGPRTPSAPIVRHR